MVDVVVGDAVVPSRLADPHPDNLPCLRRVGGAPYVDPLSRTARLGLQAGPSAPGKARRAVTSWLEDWGTGELVPPAVLLVSELVTKAITNAGPPVTLLVAFDHDGAEIAARDGRPRTPQRPHRRHSGDGDLTDKTTGQ